MSVLTLEPLQRLNHPPSLKETLQQWLNGSGHAQTFNWQEETGPAQQKKKPRSRKILSFNPPVKRECKNKYWSRIVQN